MATATDFTSAIGGTGLVGFSDALGVGDSLVITDTSEMTTFSKPMDMGADPVNLLLNDGTEYVTFSPEMDSLGYTVSNAGGTSQETRDPVPLVYKMRGWSTTLGQYVYWRSVGDPFFPAPSEYGTVINVTSELIA